jgi:hypothetical protein
MLAADNSSGYIEAGTMFPLLKKKQVCQVDDGPADEITMTTTSGRST